MTANDPDPAAQEPIPPTGAATEAGASPGDGATPPTTGAAGQTSPPGAGGAAPAGPSAAPPAHAPRQGGAGGASPATPTAPARAGAGDSQAAEMQAMAAELSALKSRMDDLGSTVASTINQAAAESAADTKSSMTTMMAMIADLEAKQAASAATLASKLATAVSGSATREWADLQSNLDEATKHQDGRIAEIQATTDELRSKVARTIAQGGDHAMAIDENATAIAVVRAAVSALEARTERLARKEAVRPAATAGAATVPAEGAGGSTPAEHTAVLARLAALDGKAAPDGQEQPQAQPESWRTAGRRAKAKKDKGKEKEKAAGGSRGEQESTAGASAALNPTDTQRGIVPGLTRRIDALENNTRRIEANNTRRIEALENTVGKVDPEDIENAVTVAVSTANSDFAADMSVLRTRVEVLATQLRQLLDERQRVHTPFGSPLTAVPTSPTQTATSRVGAGALSPARTPVGSLNAQAEAEQLAEHTALITAVRDMAGRLDALTRRVTELDADVAGLDTGTVRVASRVAAIEATLARGAAGGAGGRTGYNLVPMSPQGTPPPPPPPPPPRHGATLAAAAAAAAGDDGGLDLYFPPAQDVLHTRCYGRDTKPNDIVRAAGTRIEAFLSQHELTSYNAGALPVSAVRGGNGHHKLLTHMATIMIWLHDCVNTVRLTISGSYEAAAVADSVIITAVYDRIFAKEALTVISLKMRQSKPMQTCLSAFVAGSVEALLGSAADRRHSSVYATTALSRVLIYQDSTNPLDEFATDITTIAESARALDGGRGVVTKGTVTRVFQQKILDTIARDDGISRALDKSVDELTELPLPALLDLLRRGGELPLEVRQRLPKRNRPATAAALNALATTTADAQSPAAADAFDTTFGTGQEVVQACFTAMTAMDNRPCLEPGESAALCERLTALATRMEGPEGGSPELRKRVHAAFKSRKQLIECKGCGKSELGHRCGAQRCQHCGRTWTFKRPCDPATCSVQQLAAYHTDPQDLLMEDVTIFGTRDP